MVPFSEEIDFIMPVSLENSIRGMTSGSSEELRGTSNCPDRRRRDPAYLSKYTFSPSPFDATKYFSSRPPRSKDS
jgi:hypothetical protein